CKFEALGYKCCSNCIAVFEDDDGYWGSENNEWCGITEECVKSYDECWSNKSGYPCCDSCDIYLDDETGKWGVMNGDWCGIPTSCE
ncbi:hypothetical protein LY90DRAFT_368822, partial [Neocallimastix californiae]